MFANKNQAWFTIPRNGELGPGEPGRSNSRISLFIYKPIFFFLPDREVNVLIFVQMAFLLILCDQQSVRSTLKKNTIVDIPESASDDDWIPPPSAAFFPNMF